jgi:3',5'-cyclic AMP phosphodiesterase CpdA
MSRQTFNRRQFLSLAAAATAASALPAFAAPAPASFDFLFITDCHIQPELDATHGTDMAFKKARELRADFASQGGDHVFDALAVAKPRATQLFDLYAKTEQDLGLKVHHTIGNHDCFGVYASSGVATTDPAYGKKMYAERFGPTWYSFDHQGHHFIVLDSIGITPDRAYEGRIDADQLTWLQKDLAAQPTGTPIIVTTHIPLVTAMASYVDSVPPPANTPPGTTHSNAFVNGPATIKLFEGHNVLGVLQGHTHINERVEWHGVPYITSGAVCGNWWKGTRLGTPEGFTVVSVANGKLTTRYETTGFKSVAPDNT